MEQKNSTLSVTSLYYFDISYIGSCVYLVCDVNTFWDERRYEIEQRDANKMLHVFLNYFSKMSKAFDFDFKRKFYNPSAVRTLQGVRLKDSGVKNSKRVKLLILPMYGPLHLSEYFIKEIRTVFSLLVALHLI